jgi:hypothetical protein
MTPIADLDQFLSTRDALHQVAEHVLAKARYADDDAVRLMAFGGGFATPQLSDGRRVQVVADELLIGGTSYPLTSVAAAAAAAGVEPGFPTELYAATTMLEPHKALNIDHASAVALGEWYTFTASVLDAFAAAIADAKPSELVLWPEHFDQAFFTEDADESRRANYGASPGDAGHPEPYLYVGPFTTAPANEYWNATHFNGSVLSHSSLVAATDPRAEALRFLHTGRSLLVAP